MPSSLPQILRITKALADEHRVRMLMLLRRGELCVCQITEVMGLAPSTVSKHLSILHAAGLTDVRKEGRWAFYRLADNPSPLIQSTFAWLATALPDGPALASDRKALNAVLRQDPSELCQKQRAR